MADVMTPAQRSANMARIRGKDTKPEMLVRRMVHALGFRYRLHRKDLPGTPDMVFPGKKKIIFVHGCFWHRHKDCKYAVMPRTRREFWEKKLNRNVERDRNVIEKLRDGGWDILVVWECETKDLVNMERKLVDFLT